MRITSTFETAILLAEHARDAKKSWAEHLLSRYSLTSREGLSMMCLAEALLRIPDVATAKALVADRLSGFGILAKTPLTLPIVRALVQKMATEFVMAETIESALGVTSKNTSVRYSFDMLGESARTEAQAHTYFEAYTQAIHTIGAACAGKGPIHSDGISIKLSALYSRFELMQMDSGFPVLFERLKSLMMLAKSYDIGVTIDAEEADRLDYQLALFERLLQEPSLSGWTGLGIAVQAYQTRALSVLKKCVQWSKKYNRMIMVRLVKGAYWDTEIKRAQVLGLANYPVFTTKEATDASYIRCATFMRAHTDVLYAQFATHNAMTLAEVVHLFEGVQGMEIQRLHGMGKALHAKASTMLGVSSRVYAPVGSYRDLLAYLVRRLIENGANTSFVNHVRDHSKRIEDIVAPDANATRFIPLPKDILEGRMNSLGDDLGTIESLTQIESAIRAEIAQMPWHATSLVSGEDDRSAQAIRIFNPSDRSECIGKIVYASVETLSAAFDTAQHGFSAWSRLPVAERANLARRVADLLEKKRVVFFALLIKEAGKTLPNAIGEVREAVDFCRYYATQAELLMTQPVVFSGPTGESNQMTYRGRGVMVCISPWNFPLAIMMGQIMAALVVGNTVVAKSAKQTSLVAYHAVQLCLEAGMPKDVLQLIIGDSGVIGDALIGDPRVAGVIMTGSIETARHINCALAQKPGPFVPFIAETSGQNAMIVDSSALLEQLVVDVMQSAFDSAGQRCSALRILFLQEDIADPFIALLKGAIDMLVLGDPLTKDVDVGPVIDAPSLAKLEAHVVRMATEAKSVYQAKMPPLKGYYFPPTVCELNDLSALQGEVFGPILHVVRYAAKDLEKVVTQINAMGYGLTFGIETRIESRFKAITDKIEAGNAYVNRNMIGAVVGVQPFGGQGLSGTGPKAGGPNYLLRLVHERVLTVNTAAIGGDVALLGG